MLEIFWRYHATHGPPACPAYQTHASWLPCRLLPQTPGLKGTSQAGHQLAVLPGAGGAVVVADQTEGKLLGVSKTKRLCSKVKLAQLSWVKAGGGPAMPSR